MATAFASERPVGLSPVPTFDDPSDHQVMDRFSDSPSLGSQPSPLFELPPPNPPFVFPARPASPASAPSSFSRATGRRPMSAIETPNRSFGSSTENVDQPHRSTLPTFSFNPGASLPADPFPAEPNPPFLLSPPVSPHSPRNLPSPSRPAGHGHRRGGSEFVGGRLREGSSIAVMSTSPTKSESGFAIPDFKPPPPRRGHRRGVSGAISTNDLPILHPPVFDSSLMRGSSAPTSPTGFIRKDESEVSAQSELPAPVEPETTPEPQEDEAPSPDPEITQENSPKQAKPGNKARVGFSDTLEFIPRPLSLVSSETSSVATARPGHSLSGSISSIISMASLTPSGRDSPISLSRSSTRDMTDSRPSTAGAILERIQDLPAASASPRRRNSIPTLIHLAEVSNFDQPEPSPTKNKRWSFFVRDPSAASSPTKARPNSSGSSDSTPKAVSATSSVEQGSVLPMEEATAVPKKHRKSSKKSKKKKKKVKGWAGSILPRIPKDGKKRSKSESIHPPDTPASNFQLEDENGIVLDPELLESSTPTVTVTESPDPAQEKDGWKRSEEDSSLAMIDLDAALGPFNTPLPLNPEWEAAQRAAGNIVKSRRLHSAQGMKGFSGPGMHYHRRAESAPDLPPFDPGRAGIHRFNSSSTMADVFEEDEEDDGNASSGSSSQGSDQGSDSEGESTPPANVAKDPLLDVRGSLSTHSSTASMRRASSSLSDKEKSAASSVRAERSKSSLHDSVIHEEPPSIIFRTANVFSERPEGTDSAAPSPRKFSISKDLAPVDISPLNLPTPTSLPISPYAISHSSSFPSPRSPISVDAQRISTAPSSVTDENNFRSLLMGEPGPELRISVDYDIPSLTSSNSTMTRESMFLPTARMSQPTLREPRPVSVSSAAFGRRRSSLASLSRLISSSHGERSKLSMEVTLDSDSSHKKSKDSKAKRLSRMMQFWKPHKEGHKEGASHQ